QERRAEGIFLAAPEVQSRSRHARGPERASVRHRPASVAAGNRRYVEAALRRHAVFWRDKPVGTSERARAGLKPGATPAINRTILSAPKAFWDVRGVRYNGR